MNVNSRKPYIRTGYEVCTEDMKHAQSFICVSGQSNIA